MSRRFAFLLSLALVMAVALTGCGMNKEKAIEQMGQALTDSSVIESGRLTGEISGTISLGADSIPMELTMEGAFKDQMQTMAMKMSGEVMGNPLDTRDLSAGRQDLHPRPDHRRVHRVPFGDRRDGLPAADDAGTG